MILLPSLQAQSFVNMRFEHITTEHGLAQNSVSTIYQDMTGFMWFGTQEGLSRYDGQQFTNFRHSSTDTKSISNDNIRGITQGKNQDLWIATADGLNRFVTESQSFQRIELQDADGTRVEKLNVVYIDQFERLWVGSNGAGLSYSDERTSYKIFEQYKGLKHLKHTDIRSIIEDSKGRLWVGTNKHGVFLIGSDRNQVISFEYSNKNILGLPSNQVRAIFEDHAGSIWIGTRGGGLSRYIESTKNFESYQNDPSDINSLSHNRVYEIYEDRLKNLWVGTEAGLNIFQPQTKAFIRINHESSTRTSLSHDRIYSIYQDRSGIVWVGTISGLNKWNSANSAFINYEKNIDDPNSLHFNYIHGMAEGLNGEIFMATFGGGISVLDPKKNIFKTFPSKTQNSIPHIENYMTALMLDDNNRLWVGTVSSGVYILSQTGELVRHYKSKKDVQDSLSSNGITDILQDRDGEIWIATYGGGLNQLKSDDSGFFHYRVNDTAKTSLLSDRLMQIIQDSEGNIWIATDGGGISKLKKDTKEIKNFIHQKGKPNSLAGNAVWSLSQDSYGRFWIGIQSKGLDLWQPNDRKKEIQNFKHYNIENGLNSSTINGALEDSKENIWISSTRGVSKLTPSTQEIKHYLLTDDVHKNEFNQAALLQAKDGRLYFGGTKGISAFYPSEIRDNQHVPPVVLTQVLSENKPVNLDFAPHQLKEIVFDHTDYLIAFEFAALDYANPKKNKYQYKLEGFDQGWIQSDHLNRATFTNLPAGKYTLKVRGSNNDGIWSDDSVNLKVIINPPPWATWWAYMIYIALSISLIYWFINYRIQSTLKYSRKLEDEVKKRTTDLAKQTSEVEIQRKTIESMLARKNELFANVSHEFRTPLTLILGPVNKLINSVSSTKHKAELSIIERSGKHLVSLVEQLLNLAKVSQQSPLETTVQPVAPKLAYVVKSFQSLANDNKIQLILNCEVEANVMASDNAIEIVLSNLLSNAIKYTPKQGKVIITATIVNGSIRIDVYNTGSFIEHNDMSLIFEHFNRLEQHQHIQGSGIGLAVVKEITEVNSATIKVESDFNEGTRFILSWPLTDKTISNRHPQTDERGIGLLVNDTIQDKLIEAPTLEIENNQLDSDKPTLLVIEDNIDLRNYISENLADNYLVITAINGEDGVKIAKAEVPDIIISDVMMPKLDGFQTTKALRNDALTNHIPIILLTARGDRESRLKGWRENADEYLTKPFDMEELRIRLKNLLELRNILKKRYAEIVFTQQPVPHKVANPQALDELSAINHEFILQLNKKLDGLYDNPKISIIEIAKSLAISERQLYRKLRSVADLSPNEYLRRYRLEKSIALLNEGKSSNYVAFEVGFSSQSYFGKCFKAQYGLSPTDYKKSQ
jgi:ligand-binding sensor domain-containing protein/signal transduction histidine kinase/DNA-binding response OmpR family regulator